MVDDAKKAPHAPTKPVANVLDELCNPNGKYVESLVGDPGIIRSATCWHVSSTGI